MAEQLSDGIRHRAILASVTDFAIVATDRDGLVTDWNIGAERILGWTAAEMLGQPAGRIFTAEDRTAGRVETEMRRALGEGRAADERWHLRADGGRFWASGELMPLRDAGGGHLGFVKVLRDRTAEHADREALRESEAALRRAQEAGGVGAFSVDVAAGTLRPTPHFCRLFGMPACAEAPAERFERLVVAEDAALVSRASTRSTGAAPTEVEYRIRRADDGALRWIARKGEFERDADGRPVRFVGVALDITEQVVAREALAAEREALRASEEQFRVFAQAVPNQIWAANAEGRLYWLNQQAYLYSGEHTMPADGRGTWERLVHPDDLPAAGAAWASALASGQVYAAEFRIRRADGAYRWFLVRAEPVHAADGAILRWVGTNTDIDDQRRLNATLEEQVAARTTELMQAEEKLRQSQKMEAVGQLTGGLAHDFNNLLTGISGSLELLGIRIAQGRMADAERYILAAQGAAKRAAALTHRLLAFSRRQTLDPRPTDVNRLVQGMEDLIRRTVGADQQLEVIAAGGLWTTLIDPNQLENALLNLCINARDAMPGGGRITIETGNRWLDARAAKERELEPGQYVSLCVSDTGTGMTPEVIARAFDPFFTTKPLGLGTGLGLSMIYGFARQSGGQVRIYSEVGEGSLVCLYLPRHLDGETAPEIAPELSDAPRAAAGETVLVVDDNPTVRMLVVEVLYELGYAAIEAGDGASGLRILRSDARIDLLVTDVGLPGGMNGRQMADAGRLVRPDLRILFITGYAENAVVGNGHLDAGMHVMTKPFAMEALASRIRELIAGG